MTTVTIAGQSVDRNDEGFFTDPEQWSKEIAVELAKEEGIDELTPKHWQVIEFMRSEYFEKGTGPSPSPEAPEPTTGSEAARSKRRPPSRSSPGSRTSPRSPPGDCRSWSRSDPASQVHRCG